MLQLYPPPVIKDPPIPDSGGGRYGPGYGKQHEDPLKETRKRRILQEDEELTALIVMMVTRGLL